MPELPEVERARRLVEQVAVGRRIERLRCAKDEIVFDGTSSRAMSRALKGRTVLASRRRGKQMWWELDTRPWPLFHFAMTGQFVTPDDGPLRLAAHGQQPLDRSWPPRFWKIHLWFDDGGELAMTNARRLGRIRLRKDPEREPPIATLGFDPLIEMPSAAELSDRLRQRKTVLKPLLLDQRFAAGIGNWMADEILYQAKIDPRRRGCELSEPEARRIHSKMRSIVQKACAVDADKRRFPRTWLFHYRWGKGKGVDGPPRTARGEPIEFCELGGRTTAWVPSAQR